MTDHDEDNCPRCLECPSCEGSCLPESMTNPVMVRVRTGAVAVVCGECLGEGIICDCPCHPKDQP